jgi:DHA2 family multidrug resistance protein-like MFS transporter
VPAEAAEVARGTIGGAVSVAGELPGTLGAQMLDAAREAFAHAFRATAVLSAAIAIGVAALAVALLRRAPARA